MKKVNDLIKLFDKDLFRLNDENFCLSGSCALIIHGINVGRDPQDLDVCIFGKMNDQQLSFFEEHQDEESFYETKEVNGISQWKIERNESSLNIFYAPDFVIPKDLLSLDPYLVDRVDNIISAKAGYGRKKDIVDLLSFKSLNFNL